MNTQRELIVLPISSVGAVYSVVIGLFIQQRMWSAAVVVFCYGIAMLGARLAQLIARLNRR